MSSTRGAGLLILAALLIAVTTGVFWYGAYQLHDPHFLNRGGAALCAFGALLVIVQVLAETSLEARREADEESAEDEETSPVNRELARRVMVARASARFRYRMRIVMSVAAILFVGEVLHGWGDLIFLRAHPDMGHHSEAASDASAEAAEH